MRGTASDRPRNRLGARSEQARSALRMQCQSSSRQYIIYQDIAVTTSKTDTHRAESLSNSSLLRGNASHKLHIKDWKHRTKASLFLPWLSFCPTSGKPQKPKNVQPIQTIHALPLFRQWLSTCGEMKENQWEQKLPRPKTGHQTPASPTKLSVEKGTFCLKKE